MPGYFVKGEKDKTMNSQSIKVAICVACLLLSAAIPALAAEEENDG